MVFCFVVTEHESARLTGSVRRIREAHADYEQNLGTETTGHREDTSGNYKKYHIYLIWWNDNQEIQNIPYNMHKLCSVMFWVYYHFLWIYMVYLPIFFSVVRRIWLKSTTTKLQQKWNLCTQFLDFKSVSCTKLEKATDSRLDEWTCLEWIHQYSSVIIHGPGVHEHSKWTPNELYALMSILDFRLIMCCHGQFITQINGLV